MTAPLVAGLCVDCGEPFAYRQRGIPAVVCDGCRMTRRRRMARERVALARARQTAQDGPEDRGWLLSAIHTASDAFYGRVPLVTATLRGLPTRGADDEALDVGPDR